MLKACRLIVTLSIQRFLPSEPSTSIDERSQAQILQRTREKPFEAYSLSQYSVIRHPDIRICHITLRLIASVSNLKLPL
ncbi:hypothetical protein KIN20_015958 [Parelaphostrongylus tenuis]|uniref:Uncharacterized protein n=1 Tax=Parelaphostrongylus tenuis TaxID=148309 RepID=A0AAD5QML7_PARTN|nr:hypothetical protein KIN20_015958 [Parelaphostrongylus tenuis]